jgi:aldose 1-epimerase
MVESAISYLLIIIFDLIMNLKNEKGLKVSFKKFGRVSANEIFEYTISNKHIDIKIINYGCIITSIEVPDIAGHKKNVVAGFDNLSQYLEEHPYFGSIIGRYANRIADGKFSINGTQYQLPVNNKPNHLHGGFNGFDKKIWKLVDIIESASAVGISLIYESADMDEGYPGNLGVKVTYLLTGDNELIIHYRAKTDKPTIINLSNHSYFNLSGFEQETIHDHHLKIHSDSFTLKNDNGIPTGEILSVKDFSSLDFTTSKTIGESILEFESDKGYDQNYVLNNEMRTIREAAILVDNISGRSLKVFTNQPGMQLYTANWFDGTIKSGRITYKQHGAVALETQDFPDSPNHQGFPSTVLLPPETYDRSTIYQFLTVNNTL